VRLGRSRRQQEPRQEQAETKPGRRVRSDGQNTGVDLEGADLETPARPEFGPYDLADAPDGDQARLNLGALHIPAVPGVEIQLEAGPEGRIQQIQLAHGGSRLQIGAFAAPRSEGIWDEIRENLRGMLVERGAKPVEVEGEYGPELTAEIKDGTTNLQVRHLGIDGPRWFVHAVYLGSAAVDPERAGPLREVLRGLVVDRGTEARPVSEALPLQLPAEAAAQLAAQQRGESQAT
jgi:hypothetical protein